MRWMPKVGLLAGILCLLAGCTKQCFIHECDPVSFALLPTKAELDPQTATPPGWDEITKRKPPVNVNTVEKREPWHISLQEAIAISLENGTTGIQSVKQLGLIPDDLLTGVQLRQLEFSSDSIRVLALNPAVQGAAIEAALSKFDAKWVSQMLWSHTDTQPNGILNTTSNGDTARFETGIVKPLPTGGLAGITFSTQYQFLSEPNPNAVGAGFINPSYAPRVDLTFEQPLLQNFGTEINQLLNRLTGVNPGSSLTNAQQQFVSNSPSNSQQGNSAGFGTDGILIARLRFDQSRADFERAVNYKLLNVEAAYWNLYAAYVNLYAADQGVRLSRLVWERYKRINQFGGGDKNFKPYYEDRARGQYELFVGDRVQAVGQVLESERILRTLLGLEADDGKQLIPVDAPTLAPYVPEWYSALDECMNLRPELIAVREEVKLRQLDLELQKNFLKPDLRFVSRYGINALGNSLTGNGTLTDPTTNISRPANALQGLGGTNFTDWNLGLTLNVPLGYRYEHASVRRARLSLAQAYYAQKTEEKKAESFLTKAYRDIFDQYQQLKHRRAERESFGIALQKNLKAVEGEQQAAGSEEFLQTQRDYVNALRSEAQIISTYNTTLALFQFAKGTLLQHDNIVINEAGLPACAENRAAEHERERKASIIIHERAVCPPKPAMAAGPVALPEMPENAAPAVTSLVEDPTALLSDQSSNNAVPLGAATHARTQGEKAWAPKTNWSTTPATASPTKTTAPGTSLPTPSATMPAANPLSAQASTALPSQLPDVGASTVLPTNDGEAAPQANPGPIWTVAPGEAATPKQPVTPWSN